MIRFLRDEYQEHGHTPNFRNMLKGFQAIRPEADSKYLYDLFPVGPGEAGREGRRPAAALWQGRLLTARRCAAARSRRRAQENDA